MFELLFINPLGQIVVGDVDSANFRAVTKPGRRYQLPAWSPDGSAVLAIWEDGVSVINVESEAITDLFTGGRVPYADWSPDGQRVAFIVEEGEQVGLWVKWSGEEARKVDVSDAFYWDWMARDELLLHRGVGERGEVVVVAPFDEDFDEDREALPPLGRGGLFQRPSMSHSGRYITYDIMAEGKPHLVFADLRGENTHTVVHPGAVAMVWSPCNDEMAFIAGRKDVPYFYGQLFLLTAGGRLQPLTKRPAMAVYWARNGHSLVYLTPRLSPLLSAGEGDVIDILTDLPARLDQSDGAQQLELDVWFVDFAYGIEERKGGVLRPTSLFLTRHLPSFDQFARSHKEPARQT